MEWSMCCRDRRRGCPAVALDQGNLLIRDDDGAVVTVRLDQVYDLIFGIQDTLAANHYSLQSPPVDPPG